MAFVRRLGTALVATGTVFLIMGLASTSAPAAEFMRTFLGHHSGQTVWYIAGGFAVLAAGGLLVSTRTD